MANLIAGSTADQDVVAHAIETGVSFRQAWIVAVVSLHEDGSHRLIPLTALIWAYHAAEMLWQRLRVDFPRCDILTLYTTIDSADPRAAAEHAKIDQEIADARGLTQ